uniref:Uncharacterized protein n=1 Tax=Timema poppense TaxID=170557 RepID=A0A7R9D7N9_TIMPO|nr:unnamed protein product [Timema poppensis]
MGTKLTDILFRSCNNSSDANMSDSVHNQLGHWPHNLSSMLASLGCTLGLCNISRFAVLSIHFGANFIVQFLFLSLVFGIPLYCFHASLGQHLTAGVMDMWKISPVFQGIGIALLVSQALIGIYSIVGVSWMFIYFRDSFITKLDRYRWAEPYELYREDSRPLNGTYKLEETVPDYLNGVVLQRHNLATPESTFGHLKFQVTFNLAVVWMIVFVCLSKAHDLFWMESEGVSVSELAHDLFWMESEGVVCWELACGASYTGLSLNKLNFNAKFILQSQIYNSTRCILTGVAEYVKTMLRVLLGDISGNFNFVQTLKSLRESPLGFATAPHLDLNHHYVAKHGVKNSVKQDSIIGYNIAVYLSEVVYVFSLLPVFGMLVLCTKLLGLTPTNPSHQVFPETDWSEFFLNTKCWVAATTEAFLTWGLLGAALMQISSHNKNKHLLNRDASLVIVLTLSVLMLAAFLANTCVQLLKTGGYTYMPSSFVHPTEIRTSISLSSAVELQHDKRVSQLRHRGGWRLCVAFYSPHTKPAVHVGWGGGQEGTPEPHHPSSLVLVVITPITEEHMSSYSFLHSDRSSSPIHLTSTPVRFMGHSQFVVGSQVVQPGANSAQQSGYQALRLATEIVPATLALLGSGQASPFWAVLFYFTLILFGIAQQLCIWHCVITGIMAINVSSLKAWETTITFFSCACGFILGLPMTTELGIFVVYFLDYCVGSAWWIMILYLLEIAAVLFVRGRPYTGDVIVTALLPPETSCLTMWATPMLVFNWNVALPVGLMRISLLYRPSQETVSEIRNDPELSPTAASPSTASTVIPHIGADPVLDDPPPKYTPPPSYTTATGARIAKMLRQSFRRSVRRIASVLGEHSNSVRPTTAISPPDYAAVLVEINQALQDRDTQRVTNPTEVSVTVTDSAANTNNRQSTMTAADVAHILRSSLRRTVRRGAMAGPSESNDIKTHSTTVIADRR